MSYYNKIKESEIALPNIAAGIGGEFVFETFRGTEFPAGSGIIYEHEGTRKRVNVTQNLVTNFGLDWYGGGVLTEGGSVTGKYYQGNYCHVGGGTSAESVNDTSLDSFIASAPWNNYLGSSWAEATPIYFGSKRYKYRFDAGFAGGNTIINEVATSFITTDGDVTARSLTKDGNGDPSSVPVLAVEYLDVYYTRRNYPGHIVDATGAPVDATGSIDISGTTYNYTLRPCQVTSSSWGAGCMYGFNVTGGYGLGDFTECGVYGSDAVMGDVDSYPSSSSTDGNETSGRQDYTTASYNRDLWYYFGLDKGNVTGGIKGMVVKSTLGAYQMIFDNPIPKDNTKVFTFYHNFAWTQKTIP